MIRTILKIAWLNLRRDRAAFAMTFVLPIIFFSIFAVIFGATDREVKDNRMKIAVVDRDKSELSGRFVKALQATTALAVVITPDEDAARTGVHGGKFAAAVILLQDLSSNFPAFASGGDAVELIYDRSNPVVENAVAGLLQAAAFAAAPDVVMERGLASLENFGAQITPQQSQAIANLKSMIVAGAGPAGSGGAGESGILRIRSVDIRASESKAPQYSMVAYYAAGIGVMFLLFSMSAAGGALLDETESGTLERLLSTNASMSTVLLGKWIFLTIVGVVQVSVMFLWAAGAFHMELFTAPRLVGFAAMALATSAAAAGFGLVLATACKTRAQLSGLATILILVMSALGGSMVPRFIMPKFMETTALFTFNGWALDGFLKIFWYAPPHVTITQSLISIVPQLAMLSGLAVTFFMVAKTLAKRWETQ